MKTIRPSVLIGLLVSTAIALAANENPHGSFVADCSLCHRADGWKPVQISKAFDHAKYGFALAGAHVGIACGACHKSLEFKGTPNSCVACHQDVHRGEFGSDCARCHTTRNFIERAEQVRLHRFTRFPLTGSHVALDCVSCHRPAGTGHAAFVNTPIECESCHLADFKAAKQPDHVAGGFVTDCEQCHTTQSWVRGAGGFDHAKTAFPLTGAHRAANCTACHGDGVYKGKPTSCVSCHRPDYDRTTTPNHQAAGYSTDCQSCHNTNSWVGAGFDHNRTDFPLTGAHRSASCTNCHADGVYNGKPTSCVSCHQKQYDQTTDPNHRAAKFAVQCEQCHNTTTWSGAAYDHGQTDFPLTGAHRGLGCSACHADNVYAGKPTSCVSCHQTDYDRTTDPNHRASGFSTDCQTCHTTTTWRGAGFDHNKTDFPLTGAHKSLGCQSCHADGVYNGKPTSCVSCHQSDYDRTTDPNHRAAGFPTDCAQCHNTTGWGGAKFDHDARWFPIYSGKHRGKWSSCRDCHTNPDNFAVFTCLTCHPHSDKAKTDSNHRDVRGYSYDSNACYRCHPRGSAG